MVGLIKGFSWDLTVNGYLMRTLYLETEFDPSIFTAGRLLILLVVLPILVSASLGIIQMAVSLLIGPMTAFILVIVYQYLSAFYTRWYLLGNYSMALKSSWVAAAYEVTVQSMNGIWLSLLVLTAGIFLGIIAIRRYELYEKR